MIECTTYRSPWKLRKLWEQLYAAGEYSPFQSWISNWWYYVTYGLKGTRRKWQPRFLLMEEGDKQCIIAIAVNEKQKKVIDFSVGGPIDYYDVISSTKDIAFVKACVDKLKELYAGYEISLNNVNEKSLLINALPKEAIVDEVSCVKIVFDSEKYEDYYQSLSKHQRQNIRTGYNKLGREGIAWRIEKYDTTHKMPNSVWLKCLKMYEERCRIKKKRGRGLILRIADWKNRQINLVNILVRRWDRAASFVLYFNNEPVAYMSGIYSENSHTFYVPRLSCNNQYLRYDAGILMLNEAIKILLAEGVKVVDLTRGDEPYKLAMGGIIHMDYTYKI